MGDALVSFDQMGGKVGRFYGNMDDPTHFVGPNHMFNLNRKFANGWVLI